MELKNIAEKFDIEGAVESVTPVSDGVINDTYMVRTAGLAPDYILQRKNSDIFKDVPAMMDNIERVTAHLRHKVEQAGGNPREEVLTVIRTAAGVPYFIDPDGRFWTMCLFVPDTVTYHVADTPELAAKGGEGIGRFHAMLLDFDGVLAETIPGFHNMTVRLAQWDEAVSADRAGRVAVVQEEIAQIEELREQMMEFQRLVENGTIPRRITHNDTKISNILFDRSGAVKCVIDLDTLMSAPIHNDFGDAIRTLANKAAEDEPDLSKVGLSMPMFEAYVRGYLGEAGASLSPAELEWLAFGPLFIVYEQTLRFLMDYINGDTYYKIKYPKHNLVRARSQYALLRSLMVNYDKMVEVIKRYTQRS